MIDTDTSRETERQDGNKCTIFFGTEHKAGALFGALKEFADADINLTRIESRPSTSADWRHVFFLEMDGHITDRAILTAVEELRRLARYAKVLGSYPRPS